MQICDMVIKFGVSIPTQLNYWLFHSWTVIAQDERLVCNCYVSLLLLYFWKASLPNIFSKGRELVKSASSWATHKSKIKTFLRLFGNSASWFLRHVCRPGGQSALISGEIQFCPKENKLTMPQVLLHLNVPSDLPAFIKEVWSEKRSM